MKIFFYLYYLFFSVVLFGQKDSLANKDSIAKEYFIVKGDTLYNEAINLDDVVMLKQLRFYDKKQIIKYLILKRKTRKVYPYAKLAAERLTALNDSLQYIKSRRKQKKYTKRIQKYIEEEFSAELKKLTRTEGQILVKLIHRQTGATAFNLVKELRSGWRAFWYNSTASMFDISLKEKYDPVNNQEDFYIEDILMRSFLDQVLERQAHKLDFDYFELSDKWSLK